MNGPLARTIYGLLSAGSLVLGIAWIKFELIERPYPHDAWVAVVWIVAAAVLGWAAVRGVDRGAGAVARTLVLLAGALAIGLFVLLLYAISQLD